MPEPISDPTPQPPNADAVARRRLWETLKRPRRSQLVAGILLAALGFAAVTQVRTNVDDSSYSGYREQDLIDVLNGLAGTTQRAQAELQRLEQTRDDLRSRSQQRQAALDEARAQLDRLNILAGRVAVQGPGIRITITEESGAASVDSFLDLVQELRSVGAEAIEVNSEVRLVAQSAFDTAEGGIRIDGRLLEPPYVVEAIGEPATLAGAVTFARGPEDEFEKDGAKVEVKQVSTVKIESTAAGEAGASSGGDEGQ